MNGKITYRQQYTRCGKQRCRKCKEGAGHGPYWYAYWSENGRTISKYIGIHLPAEAEHEERQTSSLSKTGTAGHPEETASQDKASLQSATDAEATTGEARKKSARTVSSSTDPQPDLRVSLLGQFCVERREGTEWQIVANRTWQRRRARALLGCLLSHTGRRMGREQVMEALWPDLDIETAANRLNGAVHELRQILEPGLERPAASSMLRLERDILILADASRIWVDAEAFEGLLNKANATQDAAQIEQILEEAAALYGGDYLLEELYSEWAAARRESLRRGWMGLLLELAELRAARGALTSAIEPLDRLLTADPIHETAVRRLMVLLTQLDRRGEAIRAYQRLASILKRDYEADPLPETMELYKALRQGQIQVQAAHPITGPLPIMTPASTSQGRKSTHEARPVPSEPAGSALPVLSYTLPRSVPGIGRQNQGPLIGRERELETMHQILLAIDNIAANPSGKEKRKKEEREQFPVTNPARFVMLMGETGIGKTRLAEELSHKAQARGWLVAWTRAYEQEGTIPYRPWTDILRTFLQDIPMDQLLTILAGKTGQPIGESVGLLTSAATAHARLARLASLLPELTTHPEFHLPQNRTQLPSAPEQERFHLWEVMLILLSGLSQPASLLIVLDDLHWADDSSLELLAYLARHRQNERIMLLATCRDIELAPSASLRSLLNDLRREQVLVTLPLQPLTQAQIGRMLSHLPLELVLSIQSQAGGNPLFAEELARFSEAPPGDNTKEHSARPYPGQREDLLPGANRSTTLPETIAAVLERRLSRLSADCQALLSKAAVLGGSFEFSLLVRMTSEGKADEDATLDLLEEALRSGLLSEETNGSRIVYHFWHPLIVSHLYENLSAARRSQLHRRAAQALIQLHTGNEEEGAAAIAYHLGKYGQEKQQLAYYAEMAGSKAMSLSAYSEVLHHYRQALEAWQELKTSSPTLEQDPLHIANLLECMAECNATQGNYPETRQQYMQALELHMAQPVDASRFASSEEFRAWQQEEAQVQGMIWQAIGHTWRSTGEYAKTHECVKRGKEVLEAARVTGGVALACLEHLDGGIYWSEGNFLEARRHVEASLEIYEESMRKLQLQGQNTREGISDEKKPLPMTRSRRALREDPQALGRARESLGVISISMGLLGEALQHLYAALAIFETHDLVGAMGQVCSNIGAVYTIRGEYEIALSYFKRSLELIERTGNIPSKVLVTGNLGEVTGHTGNLQEAEIWLKDCVKLAEQISDRERICWSLSTLAYIQHNQGKSYEALEKIRRALVLGRSIKSTVRMGFSLVALAEWRITQALITQNATREYQATERNCQGEAENSSWRHQIQAARAAVERALALESIDSETECNAKLVLATISYLQGDQENAYLQALQALKGASHSEVVHLIGRSQRLLGQIQAARDFEKEATIYFEQALLTSRQHGQKLDCARTLMRYGIRLLQRSTPVATIRQGREGKFTNDSTYQQGLEYLREARDIFEECKASVDLQWAERLLTNPSHPDIRL